MCKCTTRKRMTKQNRKIPMQVELQSAIKIEKLPMKEGIRETPVEMGRKAQLVSQIEVHRGAVSKTCPASVKNETQKNLNLDLGAINQLDAEQNENYDAYFDTQVLPAFLHDSERRYTKEDLKYNFLAIYFKSWIKVTPYGADTSEKNSIRSMLRYKIWWQNLIFFIFSLVASVRALSCIYVTVLFIWTGAVGTELSTKTMMISLSLIFTLLMYVSMSSMLNGMQHAIPLLHSVFKYLDHEPKKNTKLVNDGNWLWKLRLSFKSHTRKELLIIYLPIGVFSLIGIIPLIYIFDPSFPLLLVSLIPPDSESQHQLSLGFISLALLDTTISIYYIMIIHDVFYLFFVMHRVQEEAKLTLKNMNKESSNRKGSEVLEKARISQGLRSIRLLHIWAHYLNVSYSHTVYVCKICALSFSIMGGFGVIKMVEEKNWPYAVLYALLHLEGGILYNIGFGEAYIIPEKVEQLKTEITKLAITRQTRGQKGNDRKHTEKFLRSVPWLGVNDGVYKMERMTCVNFFDFATQTISSLVIGY